MVSILIPAFNVQEWIGDTLCSAIGQTWEPKEVIIVDDGSTDQTLEIARRYESEGRSNRKLEAKWRSTQLHIQYLRSLEDSPRARKACITYLQDWMEHFYPERPDIFAAASEMATQLGGELSPPQLPWKYGWLRSLFGWGVARSAQLILPSAKFSVIRGLDRAMFYLEDRKSARKPSTGFNN